MVPGAVPTGAVPGESTLPDGVIGEPGWPGTPTPGVVTLPGVPGAPVEAGEPGTVVWARAAPLRPRPSRAVRNNLEDFIIVEKGKRKGTGQLLVASQVERFTSSRVFG